MNWRSLNHLCPEPQCSTKDGVITDWNDSRPQPTAAEIDAVRIQDIKDTESQVEEDNFSFPGVMVTIAKALHNHENRIRALEGRPEITLGQTIRAIRAL